jgi:hypothetical protein
MMLLAIARAALRLRRRQLERCIGQAFTIRASAELDLVLESLRPLDACAERPRHARAELARFRAWCRGHGL